MPADLLDRPRVLDGMHLVAAEGARQQHAEQPRLVQRVEHRRGQAPGALDRVSLGGDNRCDVARPRDDISREIWSMLRPATKWRVD